MMCALSFDQMRPYRSIDEPAVDEIVVTTGPRWAEQVTPIPQSVLQTMLEQGPGVLYLHAFGESPTWMTYVSPRIESVLGYPVAAWTDDPRFWCRVILDEDRDRVIEADRAAIEEGRDLDVEYRMVHHDGGVVWMHDTATIIRDVDGRPIARQGLLVDVSSRHEAEERLAEAEVRYRSLIETSPGVVYVNDPRSSPPHLLYLAPQVQDLLGYSVDDFTDPTLWSRLLHPDDRAWVLERTEAAILAEQDLELEFRMLHRSGHTVWIHDTARVVRDAEGVAIARQGIVVDVTESRETRARLAAIEERYQTLVDRLPIATYIDEGWDPVVTRYVSPEIERLTGYPAEDWVTDRDRLDRCIHPEDRAAVDEAWCHAREQGATTWSMDYRIITLDGRTVWIRDLAEIHRDGELPIVEGVLIDMTDRKQVEEELAARTEELTQANERLLELDRVRTAFFTTASHELRTPLTSLLGYSTLVDQQWSQLTDLQRREHVRTINRHSLRMTRLVRDVLTASELDQGLLTVEPQPIDVSEIVAKVARSHSPEGEHVEIRTEGRPIAVADPVGFEQIISNLLANALRYGRPPVMLDMAETGPIVEIRVRDRGPGVPNDLRARLFERFELSEEAGDRIQQGFGLGLSVARDLARAQGGELSLEAASPGATFLLALPAVAGA
jgi:PAS domain S-box-containing protein